MNEGYLLKEFSEALHPPVQHARPADNDDEPTTPCERALRAKRIGEQLTCTAPGRRILEMATYSPVWPEIRAAAAELVDAWNPERAKWARRELAALQTR